MANALTPIFQVGKEGVSENLVKGLGEALEKQELIKVAVLENADIAAKEVAKAVARPLKADVVQCIGRKFVLYRESKDHKTIILPK
jgi:RNA-binding protein